MCELLAMSANVPTDICFSFSGLMQRGGNTGPHKDGWGITFYEGKGCRSFKDPLPSAESAIATLVKEYPIKSESVICHIRQANSGGINLENTHPFTRQIWGRHWTYAHNGQLKGIHQKLTVKYHIPVGETDSEFAFCWIMDQIHVKYKDEKPTDVEVFSFVATLCEKLHQFGVYNIIITNGECLFAFCSNNLHWITRKAPFGKAKLIDEEVEVNFTQETTEKDIVTIIATQPLTNNEKWTKMLAGQWQLFKLGNSIASN